MVKCGKLVALLVLLFYAPAPAESLVRDQTLFIPEEAMESILKAQAQGAYLTYEEFLALRNAADSVKQSEPVEELPVEVSPFSTCSMVVIIRDGFCQVEVDLVLNARNPKPALVPLDDFGLSWLGTKLDGLGAPLILSDERKSLVLDGKIHNRLQISGVPVNLVQHADSGHCDLAIPDIPVLDVSVQLEGSAKIVTVPEAMITTTINDGNTACSILNARPGSLKISWSGIKVSAAPSPSQINADLLLEFLDSETILTTTLTYKTFGLGPRQLQITIPEGFDLLGASDGALGLETQQTKNVLSLNLGAELSGSGQIICRFSKPLHSTPPIIVDFDAFQVSPNQDLTTTLAFKSAVHEIYCRHNESWLAIPGSSDQNLKLQAVSGFTPVSFTLYLPGALKKAEGSLDFMLMADGFRVAATWRLNLGDRETGMVTFTLPPGTRVDGVQGQNPSQTESLESMNFRLVDNRLIVLLPSHWKPQEGVEILITADYDLNPAELAASGSEFTIQGWMPLAVDWLEADVLLSYDPNFKVQEKLRTSLTPSPIRFPIRRNIYEKPILSYSTGSPEWSAVLGLGLAPTKITGRALSYTTLAPNTVQLHSEVHLAIEGAGIDKLTVGLPSGAGESVLFEGVMIGERIKLQSSDPGLDFWELKLQDRVSGTYDFIVSCMLSTGTEAGRKIVLPLLRVQEAAGLNQLVAVEAHDEVEITAEAKSMREINVGELPEGVYHPTRRLLYAFRSIGKEPVLTLAVDTHKLLSANEIVIKSLTLTSVLSTSGSEISQVRLEILNRGLQYLEMKLPPNSDLWSAVVDEEGVKPARKGDTVMIPLPDDFSRPSIAEIYYVADHPPLEHFDRLTWPAPSFSAPILQDAWHFYYPQDRRISLSMGNQGRTSERSAELWAQESFLKLGFKLLLSPLGLFSRGCMRSRYDFWTASRGAASPANRSMPSMLPAQVAEPPSEYGDVKDAQEKIAPEDYDAREEELSDMPVAAAPDEIPAPPPSIEMKAEGREDDAIGSGERGVDGEVVGGLQGGVIGDVSQTESLETESGYRDKGSDFGGDEDRGLDRLKAIARKSGVKQKKAEVGENQVKKPAKATKKLDQVFYETIPQSTTSITGSQIKGMSSLRMHLEPYGKTISTANYFQNGGKIVILLVSGFGDRIINAFVFLLVLVGGIALTLRNRISTIRFSLFALCLLLFLGFLEFPFLTPYLNSMFFGLVAFQGFALAHGFKRRVKAAHSVAGIMLLVLALLTSWTLISTTLAEEEQVQAGIEEQSTGEKETVGLEQTEEARSGVTVYVPYSGESIGALSPTRRVYLPGEDFQRLWRISHPSPTPAPVMAEAYSFRAFDLKGIANGDIMEIVGTLEIESYRHEWITVQWPMSAWTGVDFKAERPGDLARRSDSDYELLMLGLGSHRFSIAMSIPLEGSLTGGGFRLVTPPFPVGAMVVTVPTPALEFSVQGDSINSVQTSHLPGSSSAAFTVGCGEIKVSWHRLQSSTHLETTVTSTIDSIYLFGPGNPRLLALLNYKAESGLLDELRIRLPTGATLAGIEGGSVVSYHVEPQDPQLVRITLNPEFSQEGRIAVELTKTTDGKDVVLPDLIVENALRTDRVIRLAAYQGWELQIRDQSLTSPSAIGLAAERVPVGAVVHQSFEVKPGWSMTVSYSPVPLRAEVTEKSTAQLQAGKLTIQSELSVVVHKGALFVLPLKLPGGLEVESLDCSVTYTQCKRIEESDLWLYFPIGIGDHAELTLKLVQKTVMAEQIALKIQPVRVDLPDLTVENELMVDFSDAYEVDKETVVQGKTVSCSAQAGATGSSRCYDIGAEGYVEFELQELKGEAEVTADCLVKVYEEYAEMAVTLAYRVTKGYRNSFAITLPDTLSDEPTVKGEAIRSIGSKSEDGNIVREIQLVKPIRGEFHCTVAYRIDAKEDGWIETVWPRPLQVNRINGRIALINKSLGEIEFQADDSLKSLPVETAMEFSDGFTVNEVVKAFSFITAEWRLAAKAASLESVSILRATIDYIHVTTMVQQSGFARHSAEISLINKREQYLRIRLPEKTEILKVMVAQRPVRISQREREIFIPLIKTSPWETSFKIELIYQEPIDKGWRTLSGKRLIGPEVLDIPVSKSLWTLYLPANLTPYLFRGNLQETFFSDLQAQMIMNLLQDQERIITEMGKMDYNQQRMAISNLDDVNVKLDESLRKLAGMVASTITTQSANETMQIQGEISRLRSENEMRRQQIDTAEQQVMTQQAQAPAADLQQTDQQEWIPEPMADDREEELNLPDTEEAVLLESITLQPEGDAYYFKKIKGDPILSFRILNRRVFTYIKAILIGLVPLILVFISRIVGLGPLAARLGARLKTGRWLVVLSILVGLALFSLWIFGTFGTIILIALFCVISAPILGLRAIIKRIRKRKR